MSLEIGQKVGPYEVVDYFDNLRIGAGYIVKNTAEDRVEILRLLPKDPHHDRESVDRFLREIIVHSRLAHPHIVSFYSALDIDGNLVMTTEYVPGMTLAQRIEKGGIAIAEAVAWTEQILSALSYAHQNGVVHREVSPANIIITEAGEAKLAGFGLAKGASDPELTRVGTVMGWIEYMSPEQVQGLPRVDARSDIYSTGAVLYELVTGRVPFQAGSQFEVMLAHVRETPKQPVEVNPGVPPALNAVILQALEKDPEKRFESAEVFRVALEKAAPAPAPAAAESAAEPAAAAVAAVGTTGQEAAPAEAGASETVPAAEAASDVWVFRSSATEAPAQPEPIAAAGAVLEEPVEEPAAASLPEPPPPAVAEVKSVAESAPETAAPHAEADIVAAEDQNLAEAAGGMAPSPAEPAAAAEEPKPPEPAKPSEPSGAFTWRPKTDEEIEEQQRAMEAAPPEIPVARLDPPSWARPAGPPDLPEIPPVPTPEPVPQMPSLEALLAEDPLSVAASRGYVHPPMAPQASTPAEPLPTWKLVAAGAGAFVLVGLTMYAILRSFGG